MYQWHKQTSEQCTLSWDSNLVKSNSHLQCTRTLHGSQVNHFKVEGEFYVSQYKVDSKLIDEIKTRFVYKLVLPSEETIESFRTKQLILANDENYLSKERKENTLGLLLCLGL